MAIIVEVDKIRRIIKTMYRFHFSKWRKMKLSRLFISKEDSDASYNLTGEVRDNFTDEIVSVQEFFDGIKNDKL
jgi:hypothetical protein